MTQDETKKAQFYIEHWDMAWSINRWHNIIHVLAIPSEHQNFQYCIYGDVFNHSVIDQDEKLSDENMILK